MSTEPKRNPDGTIDRGELLRQWHRQVFKLLSKAIDAEEDPSPESQAHAIGLYQDGISAINHALNVPIDKTTPDYDRLQALRDKMIENKAQATSRIKALREKTAPAQKGLTDSLVDMMPAWLRANFRERSKSTSGDAAPVSSATDRPKAVVPPRRTASTSPVITRPAAAMKKKDTTRGKAGSKQGKDAAKKSEKRFSGVDTRLAQLILDEVLQTDTGVTMDDVIGLKKAKEALREIVIWPALRPELFQGLRAPAKGLLLFGPPGNGKTMLAKAVAHSAQCTFFNISASSLTSKWVGESEKLVRALFAMARELQPSIVFIDEIDSIMTTRTAQENEASRRLKTEMLLQLDGVSSKKDDRILVMGATNVPEELDHAIIRRLTTRIFVPMPDLEMRKGLLKKLLSKVPHKISDREFQALAGMAEGYSCSDISALARDAALNPTRELGERLVTVSADSIRPVNAGDVRDAFARVRRSVPADAVQKMEQWNRLYGFQT
ncbi:spastin [Salpingoeca rosetta]|uniref:microtubule-severing ATPase n=1 Tax=Salpingoeca rosetta (strain ATCC 50818 / BSB-021) TaxID=946362 RepID=F2U0Q3_SALR5|nr:spastin [Salpingoeca rosetta]EGD80981.1 spastin [Salpingoeca rosetta]|eukprot:XP_004997542.1 spastin [Salpingoeca rosetta]